MYNFGDMIFIDYGNGENYKGVIFGDTIGYEDGRQDKLSTILDQVVTGICKIKRVE